MINQCLAAGALGVVASYLVGAIPFGYIAGRVFKRIDIRKHGSRNIGATNVFRVVGRPAGILVLVLDALKGVAAALGIAAAARAFCPEIASVNIGLLCGLGAIVGHMLPVYIGFKGGKAVATSLGVMMAVVPLETLGALAAFIIVVALTRHVSAGSITGAVVLPGAVTLTHLGRALGQDVWLIAAVWALGAMIIWRHTSNIKRLIAGTENKLDLSSRRSRQPEEKATTPSAKRTKPEVENGEARHNNR